MFVEDVMPVVVITGNEEYLRSMAAAQALEEAAGAEVIKVDPDTDAVELSSVLDELRMKSLFSGAKSVLIEGDKFISANSDALAEFISKEMPALKGSLLVLSAEKVPAAIVKAAKKAGKVIEVKKLYATDYNSGRISAGSAFGRWLSNRARELGISMNSEAVICAIETSGENLRSADLLLTTLATGGKKTIAAEDVLNIGGGEGAASQYRLEDAVLEGRLGEALEIIDGAYRNGIQMFDKFTLAEGTVTALLTRVLVQAVLNLMKYYAAPGEAMAKSLRFFASRKNHYDAAVKRLSRERIERLLDCAFSTEFAFKAGLMDGRDMLEWLAAEIAGVDSRSPLSFGEIVTYR